MSGEASPTVAAELLAPTTALGLLADGAALDDGERTVLAMAPELPSPTTIWICLVEHDVAMRPSEFDIWRGFQPEPGQCDSANRSPVSQLDIWMRFQP